MEIIFANVKNKWLLKGNVVCENMRKMVLIGLLLFALLALALTFKAERVRASPKDIWVPYDYPTRAHSVGRKLLQRIFQCLSQMRLHFNKQVWRFCDEINYRKTLRQLNKQIF